MSIARLPTDKSTKKKPEGLIENIVVLLQAILIALVIRTLIIQPFVIPSGSMKSTLLVGDYIMTTKWSYGYSRYSIPFAPNIFSGRLFGSEPQRGDVAVFRPPSAMEDDYIKRVVGVPGDKIEVREGVVYINGTAPKLEKQMMFDDVDVESGRLTKRQQYQQILPNGVSHNLLKNFGNNAWLDNKPEFIVPKGEFFMMGDNRDASADSRVFGTVPLENFVAKAQVIFFSVEQGEAAWTFWRWPWSVRFNRLLNLIK